MTCGLVMDGDGDGEDEEEGMMSLARFVFFSCVDTIFVGGREREEMRLHCTLHSVNPIDSISPAIVELGTGTSRDGPTRCSCSSDHASIINYFLKDKSDLKIFFN